MKRPLNSLFQRKRAEFDDASYMRSSEKPRGESPAAVLQALDGYDWLRQIKLGGLRRMR